MVVWITTARVVGSLPSQVYVIGMRTCLLRGLISAGHGLNAGHAGEFRFEGLIFSPEVALNRRIDKIVAIKSEVDGLEIVHLAGDDHHSYYKQDGKRELEDHQTFPEPEGGGTEF